MVSEMRSPLLGEQLPLNDHFGFRKNRGHLLMPIPADIGWKEEGGKTRGLVLCIWNLKLLRVVMGGRARGGGLSSWVPAVSVGCGDLSLQGSSGPSLREVTFHSLDG